jgi:hypothetical protein
VRNEDRLTRCEANDESLMPAASKVVRQYARYYACAFNLDIARPVLERAPYLSVVTGRTTILCIGLNRAATACPDQSTYNDRGNVDLFHSQYTSRRCLSVTAELCLNHGLAAARGSREATQLYN